ncbi:MAG: hypothetical protein E6G46_09415 [Actinobacteria bacterium]|nr:MAG: hypothetical protein E6G46_09415 [Actinomycetota bacterium]
MNDHVEIQEAIAAYVTHSLDPEERPRTEHELLQHLPGCPSCTALLRDLRELAGDLALVPEARKLSDTGEAKVMTTVTGMRPAGAARAHTLWPRAAAAVAAVALASSVAVNVVVASRSGRAEDRARQAIAAIAIAADPSAHHAVLQGARGSLVASILPNGTGVFIAHGLAAPPSGSVYELWVAKDARYIPVRTFSPDAGDIVLPFNVDAGAYASVAVTVERHYVTQPTRTPAYSGSLST